MSTENYRVLTTVEGSGWKICMFLSEFILCYRRERFDSISKQVSSTPKHGEACTSTTDMKWFTSCLLRVENINILVDLAGNITVPVITSFIFIFGFTSIR